MHQGCQGYLPQSIAHLFVVVLGKPAVPPVTHKDSTGLQICPVAECCIWFPEAHKGLWYLIINVTALSSQHILFSSLMRITFTDKEVFSLKQYAHYTGSRLISTAFMEILTAAAGHVQWWLKPLSFVWVHSMMLIRWQNHPWCISQNAVPQEQTTGLK